ncbi:uncharacterized protein LOC134768948 [Penaeus indicus]|uniref:uncharacterized protein LOC134768948 n=1 Tax=Penaeus indicus TaxID=29960 RepID=UPI00300CAB43
MITLSGPRQVDSSDTDNDFDHTLRDFAGSRDWTGPGGYESILFPRISEEVWTSDITDSAYWEWVHQQQAYRLSRPSNRPHAEPPTVPSRLHALTPANRLTPTLTPANRLTPTLTPVQPPSCPAAHRSITPSRPHAHPPSRPARPQAHQHARPARPQALTPSHRPSRPPIGHHTHRPTLTPPRTPPPAHRPTHPPSHMYVPVRIIREASIPLRSRNPSHSPPSPPPLSATVASKKRLMLSRRVSKHFLSSFRKTVPARTDLHP